MLTYCKKQLSYTVVLLFFFHFTSLSQDVFETQKIFLQDRQTDDEFASEVIIHDNMAYLGAPGKDVTISANTYLNMGSVYVYQQDSSGQWVEKQNLTPTVKRAGIFFGNSISVSENHLAIAAYDYEDIPYDMDRGAVYIFEKDNNGFWIEKQIIHTDDSLKQEYFGSSISLDSNGLLIGCMGCDALDTNGNKVIYAGSAYYYELNHQTGLWEYQSRFNAKVPRPSGQFGKKVVLKDSLALVASAYDEWDENEANKKSMAGSVFSFVKRFNQPWLQKQKLVASNRSTSNYLSYGLDLAWHGNYAVVGSTGNFRAYLLELKNGWWSEKLVIEEASPRRTSAKFGSVVDIFEDHLLIGAPQTVINTQPTGAAYLYKLHRDSSGMKIFLQDTLSSSDGISMDQFGSALALGDSMILVAATEHGYTFNNGNFVDAAGAVYSYQMQCIPATFTLVKRGDTLIAPSREDGYFLWTYCDSSALLTADSSNTLVLQENGSYQSLFIDFNGCVDSSACFTAMDVNLAESSPLAITVYPNPGQAYFQLRNLPSPGEIQVMDGKGKLLFRKHHSGGGSNTLDLSSFPRGIYIIIFKNSNIYGVQKVIKE